MAKELLQTIGTYAHPIQEVDIVFYGIEQETGEPWGEMLIYNREGSKERLETSILLYTDVIDELIEGLLKLKNYVKD